MAVAMELMELLMMCAACNHSLESPSDGGASTSSSSSSATSSSASSGRSSSDGVQACSSSFSSLLPLHELLSDTPFASVLLFLCAVLYTAYSAPPLQPPLQLALFPHPPLSLSSRSRELKYLNSYRMSVASFSQLAEELRLFVHAVPYIAREPLEVTTALAMVLYRLAHGGSPKRIGNLFKLSASSVIRYTKIITAALASSKRLYSKYIVLPSEERIKRIACGFESVTGIPNLCGAIGGTNIRLQFKPRNLYKPEDYWSPYGFYSVLLQGVCDGDGLFWDVCCNAPGGLDYATHLRASSLWRKMREGEVLQQPKVRLQGRSIQPFIVGGPSYPITRFLITPFASSTPSEQRFDKQVLAGYNSILSSFESLKNRWRILKNLNVDVRYAAQTVLACCVLHNFCELAGEPEPEVDEYGDMHHVDDFTTLSRDNDDSLRDQNEGLEIRKALLLEWMRKQDERSGLERSQRRQRLV